MTAETQAGSAPDAIIEFRDARYQLPRGQVLLNHVNFSVARGETLVLLGRSGAGKTTALKLINRLLDPSVGEVRDTKVVARLRPQRRGRLRPPRTQVGCLEALPIGVVRPASRHPLASHRFTAVLPQLHGPLHP